MKLPLTLTVRSVRQDGEQVELDCVVADADGQSVQAMPVTTSAKRSAVEVCGILQANVDALARVAHAQGRAEVAEQSDEARAESLAQLQGRTFTGSVAR